MAKSTHYQRIFLKNSTLLQIIFVWLYSHMYLYTSLYHLCTHTLTKGSEVPLAWSDWAREEQLTTVTCKLIDHIIDQNIDQIFLSIYWSDYWSTYWSDFLSIYWSDHLSISKWYSSFSPWERLQQNPLFVFCLCLNSSLYLSLSLLITLRVPCWE